MIDREYLLKKPAPPSAPKVFLDQKVLPVAINAAGAVEQQLEVVAVQVRKSPIPALAAALGIGTLIGLLTIPART